MDNSKIKNIVIIILAAVNLFLAAIVVMNYRESRAYDQAAQKSLEQAIANSGIVLKSPDILDLEPLPECTVRRSQSAEQRLVSEILGSAERSVIGGNIVMYYGENGQACYRGTGDFEILMENDSIKTGSDPEKTSRSVLKKLGLYEAKNSLTVTPVPSGGYTATATCAYNGMEVVNCWVTLTFSAENLLLISGTRFLDNISPNNTTPVIDENTAVMRFLQTLKSSGYICREIAEINQCYKMEISASGDGTLTPLWHFKADVGDFYINGVTGKTETVTQSN